MKRIKTITIIIVLAMLIVTLSGCGKSSFGVTENTEKQMVVTAENADKDAFFMTGSLEVIEGEKITITSNLAKGKVRIEIVAAAEEQSIDVFPEMDGEATITAELSGTDGTWGTVPAGSYLLRATCVENATGTVQIEVQPEN